MAPTVEAKGRAKRVSVDRKEGRVPGGRPRPLRLLPAGAIAGWGLHPLESAAFARRTPGTDIDHQRYFAGPPSTPFGYRKSSAHWHRLIGGHHEAARVHRPHRRCG